MLAGVNDSPAQARELASLLGRDAFKVNLIPYNPTGRFDGSSRDAIAALQGGARPGSRAGDRPAHPRTRHRRRVRAAGDGPRDRATAPRVGGPA